MTKSQKEAAKKEQQIKREYEEKEEARRKERTSLMSDVSFIVNCIASRSLDNQIRMLDMVNAYFQSMRKDLNK